MPDLEERKVLLSWKSPSRPFKKRSRDFFTTIGAIVFLICVILLFVQGSWPLILVILALTFLTFVLNLTPPDEVEHQITNKTIITGGSEYPWKELTSFFFTERNGQKLLNVGTKKRLYGRIIILLGNEDQNKIKEILGKYLEFKEKPETNFIDKAADWLSKKIPLEKN